MVLESSWAHWTLYLAKPLLTIKPLSHRLAIFICVHPYPSVVPAHPLYYFPTPFGTKPYITGTEG